MYRGDHVEIGGRGSMFMLSYPMCWVSTQGGSLYWGYMTLNCSYSCLRKCSCCSSCCSSLTLNLVYLVFGSSMVPVLKEIMLMWLEMWTDVAFGYRKVSGISSDVWRKAVFPSSQATVDIDDSSYCSFLLLDDPVDWCSSASGAERGKCDVPEQWVTCSVVLVQEISLWDNWYWAQIVFLVWRIKCFFMCYIAVTNNGQMPQGSPQAGPADHSPFLLTASWPSASEPGGPIQLSGLIASDRSIHKSVNPSF